jgi:hypothetical protein
MRLSLLASWTVCILSCQGADAGFSKAPEDTEARYAHTLLLYAFGGGEESESRDEVLARLRQVETSETSRILAECVAADGRLVRLALEQHEWREIERRDDARMDDPGELASFIASAARPGFRDDVSLDVRGVGHGVGGIGGAGDGLDGGRLSLVGLRDGIASGVTSLAGKQLGTVFLDASYTATLEAAVGLEGLATLLWAFESVRPWTGFALEGLYAGVPVPEATLALAARTGAGGESAVSAIDLPLDGWGEGFADVVGDFRYSFRRAWWFGRYAAVSRRVGEAPDPTQSLHLVDLGDLSDHLTFAHAGGISVPNMEFGWCLRTLPDTILASARSWTQPENDRLFGLAVHLPLRESELAAGYEDLVWMQPWIDILHAMFDASEQAEGPKYLGTDGPLDARRQFGDAVVGVRFDDDTWDFQVEHRTSAALLREDGTELVLEDHQEYWRDFSLLGWWLVDSALVVRQGDASSPVYRRRLDSSDWAAAVPFSYRPTEVDEAQVIFLQFQGSAGGLGPPRYVRFGETGWREFHPSAGARMQPLLRIRDPASGTETWESGDLVVDLDRPFHFEVYAPPADPVPLSLTMEAFGLDGRSDLVRSEGVL